MSKKPKYYNKFYDACKAGSLILAKDALSQNKKLDIYYDNEATFLIACKNGHFEIAKWLYQIKVPLNIEKAFLNACKNGHFTIAKWLYEVYPNIHISEEVFLNTCENNYFRINQWLYEVNPKLNISDQAFLQACQNDNFKMVQWIYQINPNIDLLTNNNIAFYICCGLGNLEIAQWLYEKNKEPSFIKEGFENIFYEPWYGEKFCVKSKINVAKWLYSLDNTLDPSIFLYEKCPISFFIFEILEWFYTVKPSFIDYFDDEKCKNMNDDYFTEFIWKKRHINMLNYTEKIKKVKKIGVCNICLETANIITNCNHQYCNTCINEYLQQNINKMGKYSIIDDMGDEENIDEFDKYIYKYISCPYCRNDIKELFTITI